MDKAKGSRIEGPVEESGGRKMETIVLNNNLKKKQIHKQSWRIPHFTTKLREKGGRKQVSLYMI